MGPEHGSDLVDFVRHPDTLAIISRHDSHYTRFIESNPYLRTGRILSGGYVISYIAREHLNKMDGAFTDHAFSTMAITLALTDRQDLDAAGISQVQQHPYLGLRGRGVLLGVVDTGIDYTNDIFRWEDGSTRIQYLWDQSLDGTPPPGFPMGREFTANNIDLALDSDQPYAQVPSRDEDGHGTFIASLMGGHLPRNDIGAAPDADFVVVKLRPCGPFLREQYLVPDWQPNAYSSADVMLGIDYILERAAALGRPVAICLALGSNLGGQDGFSTFEQYLTYVTFRTGVCLCTSAGNESQAAHHTQGILSAQGDSQAIDIIMDSSEDDLLVSLLNTVADRFSVSVRSPTGEVVGRIPARNGLVVSAKLVMEHSSVQIEYYYPVPGGGQQTYVKFFDPTPGIWTIMMHGDLVLNGSYHAYLPITGMVSPGTRFLAPYPYSTIVTPGTAVGIICCGGYSTRTDALYIDSSWGPTRTPIIRPDLVAPGMDVGGVFPGGVGTMTGTSVSAAITAGAGALMLQWGIVEGGDPYINTQRIRAFLIRGCKRDPGRTYPNEQWGYGRLDLISTFDRLRET